MRPELSSICLTRASLVWGMLLFAFLQKIKIVKIIRYNLI